MSEKSQTKASASMPAAPPVRFGGDSVIWAAWLYYEEKLTQEEIARRMGLSRATVVSLLQRSRDEGVVSISVAPQHLQAVSVAQRLSERFGVADCLVLPEDDGRLPHSDRIGRAAARLLADRLKPGDVLGVAWGRTVLALSQNMPPLALPSVSVVQIAGSAVGTYAFSAELCVSNIANRIQGRCIHLHAPGLVSNGDVKRLLMQEKALTKTFAIMETCNRLVFGVGSPDMPNTVYESEFITEEEAAPYRRKGAIAFLAGRFLNSEGEVVTGDLDDRMIGMTIPGLDRIPERLCVSGGPGKALPIRAALRGGHVTTLVTTEATARQVLEIDDDLTARRKQRNARSR